MATLIRRTSEVAVPASKIMRSMTWGLPNTPSSGGSWQVLLRRIPLRSVGLPTRLDYPSTLASTSTSTCKTSNLIWNHLVTRSLSTSKFSQKNADSTSLARQNFHDECEAHINQQINLELYASYVYMSMAYYFDRDDVALPGFHKYFRKSSDEERGHAEKLMKYLNMRGGRIRLQAIEKPPKDDWSSPLEAATKALELEKAVNQSLLALHTCAENKKDPQLSDFVEGDFLESQVEDIKELADMIATLQRVGPGLGEYIFDEDLGNQSD